MKYDIFPVKVGSNSITKYCNSFEMLQYLLQYFEILQCIYCNSFEILQYLFQIFRDFAILIAILLRSCNTYCNTFEILQYFLQYFESVAIPFVILSFFAKLVAIL